MNREEFMEALEYVDETSCAGDPLSKEAQRIADHDADRRVLLNKQRAEIERLQAQLKNEKQCRELVHHILEHDESHFEPVVLAQADAHGLETLITLRRELATATRIMNEMGEQLAKEVRFTNAEFEAWQSSLAKQLATAKREVWEQVTHELTKRRNSCLEAMVRPYAENEWKGKAELFLHLIHWSQEKREQV